nr:hypothetical protein [Tanacetum cinerariifolium]
MGCEVLVSSGSFLTLLADVCKGKDNSMGLPGEEGFWDRFAEKFGNKLQQEWDANTCESFGKRIQNFYLRPKNDKDPYFHIIQKYGPLLQAIFQQHPQYFSSWGLPSASVFSYDHQDVDNVPETPPTSNSSVKRARASQSKGTRLSKDVEEAVQEQIDLLINAKMLTMTQVTYAESQLSNSIWASNSFLRFDSLEKKRDFILKSMDVQAKWNDKRMKTGDGCLM